MSIVERLDLTHLSRVFRQIWAGRGRRYGSAQLFIDYLRIIFRSILYHKARQIHDRFFSGKRCSFLGYSVEFYNYSDLIDLIEEIFIFEVYRCAPAGGLIIDCGANIGISVLYFRINFPSLRIVAFEPSAQEFRILRENIDRNNIQNIQLYNFALGDKEGTAQLVSTTDGSASLTKRVFFSQQTQDGPSVSVRRLSDYIESKIAVLKIDIEGAEVAVIRELEMSKKIKLVSQIVVEFHHEHSDIPLQEFLQMLTNNGYTCRHESDQLHNNPAFSLIYAARKML